MKKCILLFFVLCMAAGFTAAQDANSSAEESSAAAVDEDEGIGLSAGLEFGIGNINKANDEDMSPWLTPMLIYENSFLDEALDIYAELNYTLGFSKEPNDDGDEVLPQSIYLDLMAGYNLGLGSASTLSFILENEFDEIILSPRFEEINALTGIFTPAVKFNQNLDFRDLFAQIGVPITYIQYDKDADSEVGLDFTLGWSSTFGLGIEAKICTLLAPSEDNGYKGFETIISYETEPIYIEVEIIIPKEVGDEGVTITPEFDYSLGDFTFYVNCEFSGIGLSEGDASITPALGVKYSF
jgi:hypothetical protein